jgi:transposase
MFKRFRRTAINWPLPEEYTPERLEEELYAFNLETNLPVKKAARTGRLSSKSAWQS